MRFSEPWLGRGVGCPKLKLKPGARLSHGPASTACGKWERFTKSRKCVEVVSENLTTISDISWTAVFFGWFTEDATQTMQTTAAQRCGCKTMCTEISVFPVEAHTTAARRPRRLEQGPAVADWRRVSSVLQEKKLLMRPQLP